MEWAKEPMITVENILENCMSWGVPHFQRGGVWDMSNRAALLESLYFDTPCGSVILWDKPDKNFGIPLYEDKGAFDYLIIDGQQRIRTLMAAFKEIEDDESPDAENQESHELHNGNEESEPSSQNLRKYWSINLESLNDPGFKNILDPEAKAVMAPLFVHTSTAADWNKYRAELEERHKRDGKTDTSIPPKRYLFNSIPLKSLLEKKNDNGIDARALITEGKVQLKYVSGPKAGDEIKIEPGAPDNPEVADLLSKLEELSGRVREIKTRKLFLKVLPSSWGLDQVIDVFIRINSGGRPVEEEERAFSQLLRLSASVKKLEESNPSEPEVPKNAESRRRSTMPADSRNFQQIEPAARSIPGCVHNGILRAGPVGPVGRFDARGRGLRCRL